jgi:hypothetical protein
MSKPIRKIDSPPITDIKENKENSLNIFIDSESEKDFIMLEYYLIPPLQRKPEALYSLML